MAKCKPTEKKIETAKENFRVYHVRGMKAHLQRMVVELTAIYHENPEYSDDRVIAGAVDRKISAAEAALSAVDDYLQVVKDLQAERAQLR